VQTKSGRLRFKRTGKTLQFLWSAGLAGDDFEKIHECDYPEEVRNVRLFAETNRQPRNLDVRLVDLRIHGGPVMAESTDWLPHRSWLWAALLIVLALSMMTAWLYLRQKRERPRTIVPAP
jgi:hypothetical protein